MSKGSNRSKVFLAVAAVGLVLMAFGAVAQRGRQGGGFEIVWSKQGTLPGGEFGSAVAFVGNVYGDEPPELAVGAYKATPDSFTGAGRV
ncbi:MAG: integrin alpha, partial [Armatimonadetes bacterium]|nr:integrin alpha [Armatimonadota bacterium]